MRSVREVTDYEEMVPCHQYSKRKGQLGSNRVRNPFRAAASRLDILRLVVRLWSAR